MIDLVGSSRTVQLGIDSIIKGGKLIVVGLFAGDIILPTPPLPLRAITIQGSYVGSLDGMAELLQLVRPNGAPNLRIGRRLLAAVNEALNELRAGNVIGRLMLTADGG